MLRRDDSKDQMPGMAERNRESQVDPRTGLGFSTTESADMGVVPNQERKMSSPMSYGDLPGTQVTRSDLPGQAVMSVDPGGKTFSPTSGLPPAIQAALAAMEGDSAKRAAEIDDRAKAEADKKKAEEEAKARAAAGGA